MTRRSRDIAVTTVALAGEKLIGLLGEPLLQR